MYFIKEVKINISSSLLQDLRLKEIRCWKKDPNGKIPSVDLCQPYSLYQEKCYYIKSIYLEGEEKKKYTDIFKSGGNILDQSASKP